MANGRYFDNSWLAISQQRFDLSLRNLV